jgi:histidine phosphotransferase ChpT
MTVVTLDSLDLAALLASRICHDVISPVGAIVNGLEVLEEEKDEQMRIFALDLVKKSSKQASARLQFCRIAFGAAGSAGASIDTGDAESVARNFLADSKAEFSWAGPRALLPKNRVKLLLNLVIIANTTIPRGGKIDVTLEGSGFDPDMTFRIITTGISSRIPAGLVDLLDGKAPEHGIDAHVIQPYYTGLIGRAARMDISVEAREDGITIIATPQPAEAPAEVAAENNDDTAPES